MRMQLSVTSIQSTDELEIRSVFRIAQANSTTGKSTPFQQAEEALAARLDEVGLAQCR